MPRRQSRCVTNGGADERLSLGVHRSSVLTHIGKVGLSSPGYRDDMSGPKQSPSSGSAPRGIYRIGSVLPLGKHALGRKPEHNARCRGDNENRVGGPQMRLNLLE